MTTYILQCENCHEEFPAAQDQTGWLMLAQYDGITDLEICVFCPACEDELDVVFDAEIDPEDWAVDIIAE